MIGLVWVVVGGGGLLAIAAIALAGMHLPRFLAVTRPLAADILVVEGWIPDQAVKGVISEVLQRRYRKIVVIGPPLWKGFYLSQYKTYAELTAATLISLGISPDLVQAVPCPAVESFRTYTAACHLYRWLQQVTPAIKAINLYTYDCHARRSWLVFKRVCAPQIKVGIIAAPALNYNPRRWWQTSVGCRQVATEAIAYGHTRFFNWRA
ncbi:cytosine deaminase [Almyronema epifaneia]|uniref:Cytosine deaminase n=1 Tax=Almyronema epifaneia S1 TaxID=2991925 RepID=A0ABW6IGC5_9CYAN